MIEDSSTEYRGQIRVKSTPQGGGLDGREGNRR